MYFYSVAGPRFELKTSHLVRTLIITDSMKIEITYKNGKTTDYEMEKPDQLPIEKGVGIISTCK